MERDEEMDPVDDRMVQEILGSSKGESFLKLTRTKESKHYKEMLSRIHEHRISVKEEQFETVSVTDDSLTTRGLTLLFKTQLYLGMYSVI